MVYGVLNTETGEFRYASAGHPPVVHVPAGKEPRLLKVESLAIGWVDGIDYSDDESTVQLSPGDRIYLYSDGIPEGMDKDLNEFGDDRMLQAITAAESQPFDSSVKSLLETVQEWCVVNGPKDDISIVGFELSPAGVTV